MSTLNPEVGSPFFVYYPFNKPSLNTRKDPHRISRNALTASLNMWTGPSGVFEKRPGVTSFSGGASGTGIGKVGVATARFLDVTWCIFQESSGSGNLWAQSPTQVPVLIHGNSAFGVTGFLSKMAGQLYDASLTPGSDTVFLCFGKGNPTNVTGALRWTGTVTTFNGLVNAASPATVTPTNMQGIYQGQNISFSPGTGNQEYATVITVGATTFTVNLLHNHANNDQIIGQVDAPGSLPTNFSNSASIDPKYSATLFSHLFYAGETSAPTAVYVSDPQAPETFSTSFFNSSVYPGTYQPALIGHNDGVNGGDITGLASLGSSMIVFKQNAIYRMDQIAFYNDMVWDVTLVSASVGCVASNSITKFDSFIVFLGFDGVYTTDGWNPPQKISTNIPTYFEGPTAICTAPIIAFGSRLSHWYLLQFSDNGTSNDRGLWFDFDNLDEDGFPATGEIQFNFTATVKVGGVAELRGPNDTGQIVVYAADKDQMGQFPTSSTSDFGGGFQVSFQTKQDYFEDLIGLPEAAFMGKWCQSVSVLFDGVSTSATITPTIQIGFDGFDNSKTLTANNLGTGQTLTWTGNNLYQLEWWFQYAESSTAGYDVDGLLFKIAARPYVPN